MSKHNKNNQNKNPQKNLNEGREGSERLASGGSQKGQGRNEETRREGVDKEIGGKREEKHMHGREERTERGGAEGKGFDKPSQKHGPEKFKR